jgi:N-acetylmuramoyl-L-alanine amidase
MRNRMVPALLICLFFFVAGTDSPRLSAAEGKPNALLQQVRYWCSAKYTRVVFDLDREVDYYVGRLGEDASAGKPARIYVDLRETLGSKDVAARVELAEGPVLSIRAGRYDRTTTRLVLDLRHAEDHNVFRLEGPFRIVLDLWWKKDGRERPGASAEAGARGPSRAEKPSLPLIVIDPGHGGRDPGAVGRGGLEEKDVALGIALYVKNILEGQKKAKVVLTRDHDQFVPLERRAWIANSKDADLFVSIHANAHPNRSVSGVETYYLDNTTDRAAMRVASLENATKAKEGDDLNRILIDLRCNVNAWESNELAHTMQKALIEKVRQRGYKGTRDLGAKGSLFYVLIGAHMPSILVEVAFITNPTEEKRLKTHAYRKALAQGVARGITDYLQHTGRSDLLARHGGG